MIISGRGTQRGASLDYTVALVTGGITPSGETPKSARSRKKVLRGRRRSQLSRGSSAGYKAADPIPGLMTPLSLTDRGQRYKSTGSHFVIPEREKNQGVEAGKVSPLFLAIISSSLSAPGDAPHADKARESLRGGGRENHGGLEKKISPGGGGEKERRFWAGMRSLQKKSSPRKSACKQGTSGQGGEIRSPWLEILSGKISGRSSGDRHSYSAH